MKTPIVIVMTLLTFISATPCFSANNKNQITKSKNNIEDEVMRAKTRKDFERVLGRLGLIIPNYVSSKSTVDEAMKIPLSKRLKVFYYVQKSSCEPLGNYGFFLAYGEMPEDEFEITYQAASILFHKADSNSDRTMITISLNKIKKERRIAIAKYVDDTVSMQESGVRRFITAILEIPEDDIPDVIGRTLTVYKKIGESGSEDLIRYIKYIPKERRDFIMEEAKKLYNNEMNSISKSHLINGLSEIKEENFNEIVSLGKEVFFNNTQGGHMSLIMRSLEKNVEKDLRPFFIKHVKTLLKATDSSYFRMEIICALSHYSKEQLETLLRYIPASLTSETREKIFNALSSTGIRTYSDEEKSKMKEKIEKIVKYLDDNLSNNAAVSEDKFLTTILSAVQSAKIS